MAHDIPSISDLEAIQLLNKHYAEVITSKEDGVASGLDITQTTNPITGVTRRTLYKILDDMDDTFLERLLKMAFTRVGSFTTGATLTDMRQVLEYNGHEYGWAGTFPKVVAAGSTPATSGGIGTGAWVDRTDETLRSEISAIDGAGLIGAMSYAQLRAYSGAQTTVNVWGISNAFDGAAGTFKVDVSDTTSADNGGTILVDVMGRRWKRIYSEEVNVLWFGADRNGIVDSTTSFNNCASFVSTVKKKSMYAPSGEYKLSATLLFDFPEIEFYGDGRYLTRLKFSNPGIAVRFSAAHPNHGSYTFGGKIRDMWISGNANTTSLLYVQPNHFHATNINLSEASPTDGVGLHILGIVLGCFEKVYCSTNAMIMTSRPNVGILVDRDPITLGRATANSFMHCVIEGMSGDGVQLANSDQSMFIGGTSENNSGNGVTIIEGSRMNTFISTAFEHSSPTTFADVFDGGFSNRFINCYSSKRIYIDTSAQFTKIEGGFHQNIAVNGDFATVQDLKYSFFAAGGSVSIKKDTSYRNLFNANTSALTFPMKAADTVPVGASPFTYTNGEGVDLDVVVFGGTVLGIVYFQGGVNPVANIGLGGTIRLAPGDAIRITHTGAPTLTRLYRGVNFS